VNNLRVAKKTGRAKVMEQLSAFLNAIPSAAASPLALIAYLATLVAWTLVAMRVNRFKILMDRIEKLPEKDRIDAIKAEIGRDVPEGMSAEQFLRSRIHLFVLVGFLVFCATATFVASMALIRVYEQMARADGFINEVLSDPPSTYRSSFNMIANGAGMIREGGQEIKPPLSKDDMEPLVDRWVRQHTSPEKIIERLAEVQGTARLRHANATLTNAAATLDASYEKLSGCFRAAECRRGYEFEKMCKAVGLIQQNLDQANRAASKIDGLVLNASGTKPMMSDGPLDVYFISLSASNVSYLHKDVCADGR
jgi:hypothetical protein